MPTPEQLAEQFEVHRPHVRAVAYRMLGSVSEAEDAVQEAWIRLGRTDVSSIDNMRGDGDFETLVKVLDPEIVLRADGGTAKGMSRLVRGAQAVVGQAAAFSKLGLSSQVVLVNGNIGVVSRLPDGRVLSVIGFTIAGGKVVEMDILADPDRVSRLDLSAIESEA
jgi:hypothetical protein